MLSKLQSFMAAAGIAGELSLEERMACGFGACLGCAVALRDSAGGLVHKRVCADGPVFPAGEVILG
jgi:dihydroorotate dehydrogenase electron transfer subunit